MTAPRNDIPGFTPALATLDGIDIAYETGGSGPPLLLLHGFPQTRAMWADVAPVLAQRYSVICPDLRGYGESSKPKGLQNYSFREMGRDQLALMRMLGFARFDLVGHDRGARTAHRMTLDAPEAVRSLTVMDIIPTHLLLNDLTHKVARAYYHWFYMAQPEPFPERMIAADPDAYYTSCLLGFGAARISDFKPAQLDAYRAAWADPDCRRAMCDDYRAAIDVDFSLDAGDLDRRVTCPSNVLFGADGAMARAYDVPATWEDRLSDMTHAAIPGGHFFVDQSPAQTAAAIDAFLARRP
jgi:haloacetate dehalogenase